MKKRILSIVLAIVMLCTMLPQITMSADAAPITNPAQVSGSDFTGSSTLAQKLNAIFAGNASIYSNNGCTNLVNTRLGTYSVPDNDVQQYVGPYGKNALNSGTSCWIYANGVYYTLFGEALGNGTPGSNSTKLDLTKGSSSKLTYNNMCLWGVYNGVGAQVRVGNHSLIVLGYDSGGMTYLDGNGDGNGLVAVRDVTWTQIANSTNTNGTVHYIIQPKQSYMDSKFPGHTCDHSFKDCGVCSKCGFVYDWESTLDTTKAGRYKALKAFTPRVDQPYSAATSANFCVVTGATYNVVGVYTNAYKTDGVPNKWYKFESGGKTYYGYSGDFEFVEYFDQEITGSITSPANGAVIPKASYPIKGTVTSSRYPLQKVDAYLDGAWYATVTLGNSKTLSLQNSQIDTKLKVQDLAPGEHRLTLRACDIHHSSSTVVVCSNLFTVSGSGSGSGSGTSSYTLSFDSQDGSSVGSITAAYGSTVTIPSTVPVLYGSNFEGWEASDGTVYQPGDTLSLTKNMTLTARWIDYWITYESVGSWAHDLAYPGVGYYCKLYIPERGVYKIEGHSAIDTKVSLFDSNGNLLASDDDSGEEAQFLITANLSVLEPYYMMCIEPYYSTHSGELVWSVVKGKTLEYRDPVTQQVYEKDFANQPTIGVHEVEAIITSFIPTKAGYTFLGWSTSSTATTPMYQPGEYVVIASDATSYNTVTLYPVWEQVTEFQGIRQTYSYTILQAGQGTTFTLTVPESGTYRFIGLNDSSLDTKIKILDSNGNLIAENDDGGVNRQFSVHCNMIAGEKYAVTIAPYSGSATGTMRWQIDLAYDVRYIAAGSVDYLDFTEGDCSYPLGSGIYEYVVTTIVPTRPGYRFLGWSTDAYATVAEYQAGETVQLDTRLLYAVWERTGISGTCGDNLTWTLSENGTLTISGTGRMFDYMGDAPWVNKASTIRQVVIEQGVDYIGLMAFRDCGNVTSVIIPDSVTRIADCAFYNCSGLTSVTIPDSVTHIDYYAFYNCSGLTSVTIPDSVTDILSDAFYGCTSLSDVYYGGKTSQWEAINIEATGNEPLVNATLHTTDVALTKIAVYPAKTEFWVGETLDFDFYGEVTVIATYSDGSTQTITRGLSFVLLDSMDFAGEKRITVTYENVTAEFTITVKDPEVTGIAIKTQPSKTEYWVGESLDTAGLTLTATYSDGSTETVSSGFTTSGFSSTTAGNKTVTVTYNGKTATFTATVKTPTVTGIVIKTQPIKTEYWIGEELDTTGLTLTATYSDGSTQTVSSGFTTSGFSSTTAGNKTVTVTYNGKTATFTATVKTPTVTGIVIKTQPIKTEYWIGEELDTTGLTLTATYSDGSTKTVSSGFTTYGFGYTTAGSKTVTVIYNGMSATFTVTVKTPTITGIVIKTRPSKTEYWVGEELDTTGLTLTATYSDGSTQTVTEGFTTSGFSSATAGSKTVTVTYNGKTATFSVTVKTPTVTGITIKTQPTKTEYWIGEELDTTGLTLTATYSDGSTQTVSSGFTTSGFSNTTAGSKTVTVTYSGKTATFDVVVNVPDPEIDENAPQIIVDSVRGTKGNTVNVRIRLKNNPGIAAMKLKVAFGSALTLTKVTYNSEVSGQFQPPQLLGSPVTLNWFNGVADCEGDWVYATLTFLVSEDAQEGTSAAVSVTYEPDNVYDISETNIPFVVENGSVLIANYIPGDINGDESVNMKDVTRLFQYMSDWDVAVVEAALDVNGDGNVNMKDVTRLFQYMSDWDVEIY